jgi:hypothetical protein
MSIRKKEILNQKNFMKKTLAKKKEVMGLVKINFSSMQMGNLKLMKQLLWLLL